MMSVSPFLPLTIDYPVINPNGQNQTIVSSSPSKIDTLSVSTQSIQTSNGSTIQTPILVEHYPTNEKVVLSPSECRYYPKYLISKNQDLNYPEIVDIVAEKRKSSIQLSIVFRLGQMEKKIRPTMQKETFVVYVNGTTQPYKAQYHRHMETVIVASYILPPMMEEQFTISVYANKSRVWYKNLIVCQKNPSPHPHELTICAICSPFNPIPLIETWLAYYQVHKVPHIVLYVIQDYPELRVHFSQLIKEGKLEIVDFQFTMVRHHGEPIIYNIQEVQINSCYRRFRSETKMIMLFDLDEFVVPIHNPNSLIESIYFGYNEKPEYKKLHEVAVPFESQLILVDAI